MPTYDNKWLNERERKRRLGVLVERAPGAPSARPDLYPGDMSPEDVDAVLADDKAFAARPSPIKADKTSHGEAVRLSTGKPGPALQGLTQGLSTAGSTAVGASLPVALVPGAQPLSAALGVGGTLAQVPDMLRRGLAPEPGEEGPGVLEGLITSLGLLPGLGKGAQAVADTPRPSATALQRLFSVRQASELPYVADEAAMAAHTPSNMLREGKPLADTLERQVGGGVRPDPANLHRTGTMDDILERVMPQAEPNIDRTRTYGDLGERAFGGGVQVEQPLASSVPTGQNPAFDRYAADEMGAVTQKSRPSLDWMQQSSANGRTNAPARAAVAERFPNTDPSAWDAASILKHRSEGPMPPAQFPSTEMPASLRAMQSVGRQSKLAEAAQKARAIRERVLSMRSGLPMGEGF